MFQKLHITKNTFLRALIFLASVVVLYGLIPRDAETSYSYEMGRPWNYDAVVASTDIPIYETAARQKEIEDSMKRELKPIYLRNEAISSQVVGDFAKAVSEEKRLVFQPFVKNQLVAALRGVYDVGLIDAQGGTLPPVVRMRISDTNVKNVNTSEYYTFSTAYEKLQEVAGGDTLLRSIVSSIPLDLHPNIVYDSVTNAKAAKDVEMYAHSAIDRVTAGTKIVGRNEIVTPRIYTILQTYEKQLLQVEKTNTSKVNLSNLGVVLLLLILMGMQFAYLRIMRQDLFENPKVVLLTAITIVGFVLFAFVMNKSFAQGIYMVPFTIIPIILIVFLDSRTAFFTYMVTIVLVAATSHFMWDFVVMQFVAGFVALISIRELSRRSQLVQTGLFVFLVYSVLYFSIECMQTGTISMINHKMFGAFAINAVLISFAYILIFLIEKSFGLISRVTLIELSDINNPLLRELSEECPGTFQHSLAVSNMAAAAASRVGANVQLVRAGALYHDIGKIANPAFFTENQHGVNPHTALSPIQSAQIVIEHIKEGLRRAEKAKLPPRLRDFILEHHGRGTARYFYTTYCNQHPEETVDVGLFTYPGPNPQSLETSILMMTDSVEAASRSLSDYSPQSIEALVNKVVDAQVAEGLHSEAPISFRDILEIKKSFIASLSTMYHSRISYPEAAKQATGVSDNGAK